jgi:DNA-binding phage protein
VADIQDILARNLQRAIDDSGYALADLARDSGVKYPVIYRILNKKAWPELETLRKLVKPLGISIADLFQSAEPPKPVTKAPSVLEAVEILVKFVSDQRKKDFDSVLLRQTLEELERRMRKGS